MKSVVLVMSADVNVEVAGPGSCFELEDGFLPVDLKIFL